MKIKDLPKEILSDMFLESGLRPRELPQLLEYDISSINLKKRTLYINNHGRGTAHKITFSTNVINGVKHCNDETIELPNFEIEVVPATLLIGFILLVIYVLARVL